MARVQVAAAHVCHIVAGGALHWAPESGEPSGKLCLVGAGEPSFPVDRQRGCSLPYCCHTRIYYRHGWGCCFWLGGTLIPGAHAPTLTTAAPVTCRCSRAASDMRLHRRATADAGLPVGAGIRCITRWRRRAQHAGQQQQACILHRLEQRDTPSVHAGNPAAAAGGLPLLAYDVVYASLLAEQGLLREALAYISTVQV
jgi:hypothetical protein